MEEEAVELVKFLWKRKHFKERSWKRKQTRKRLTLSGAESGSKKYSTASTSLVGCIESRRKNAISFYQLWACQQKWSRMGFKPTPDWVLNRRAVLCIDVQLSGDMTVTSSASRTYLNLSQTKRLKAFLLGI